MKYCVVGFSTQGVDKYVLSVSGETLKEGGHGRDVGVGGRIILK